MGFEPTTPGSTIQCSNQLSYTHRQRRSLTDWRVVTRRVALALAVLSSPFSLTACTRAPPPASPAARQEVADRLDAFERHLLEPARIPPPSVDRAERTVAEGGVSATVRLVLPEEAQWNRWRDGSARLFNNRVALLFDVRVDGPGPLTWHPERTTLELNDEHIRLFAAPDAEVLLGGLLVHALLAAEWGIETDLVDRTRAAGPFRDAYLEPRVEQGPLEGVAGFQLWDGKELLGDMHVAAMRLRLVVESAGEERVLEAVIR